MTIFLTWQISRIADDSCNIKQPPNPHFCIFMFVAEMLHFRMWFSSSLIWKMVAR